MRNVAFNSNHRLYKGFEQSVHTLPPSFWLGRRAVPKSVAVYSYGIYHAQMATFNNITAESFAQEANQEGGRKRQRHREAVSCLQCRQKKVKVGRYPLSSHLHNPSHRIGSAIAISHVISVLLANHVPDVPTPRQ